jgi:hypothetical protein
MEAIQTANGKYAFDRTFYGRTLDQWVQAAHKDNSEKCGWTYSPLKKGGYGYDNMAICCGDLLKQTPYFFAITSIVGMCNMVHESWTENYVYWRDHQPWEAVDTSQCSVVGAAGAQPMVEFKPLPPPLYFKPYKPFGDEDRESCAHTPFDQLPAEQQRKDEIIATFIKTEVEKFLTEQSCTRGGATSTNGGIGKRPAYSSAQWMSWFTNPRFIRGMFVFGCITAGGILGLALPNMMIVDVLSRNRTLLMVSTMVTFGALGWFVDRFINYH